MLDSLTLTIAAAVFVAYLAGAAGPRLLTWRPRRGRARPHKPAFKPRLASPRQSAAQIPDAAGQLRIVMTATFEPKKLMSKDEARIFYCVEQTIKASALPWRVMAQVNLGEILKASSPQAHSTINSKRVDILIITNGGEPVAAVEYQGSGHYLGTAAARDAVKKEALRRAGIRYIEITPSHTSQDIAREVDRVAQDRAAIAA
jgi:Protein of unknown function (DUF2726)